MEARSLVGYGVSSDSGEDEGESNTQTENGKKAKKKSQNFLLESALTSSSESEEEEDQEGPTKAVYLGVIDSSSETLLPLPFSTSFHKLPPPPLGRGNSHELPAGSSVFANPFKEKAEKRLNVLQKHVPLTMHARPTQIGGIRICLAYRKNGRCRFGIRCKFAHDSDLQSSTGIATESVSSNNRAVDQTEFYSDSLSTSDCRTSALEGHEKDEENSSKLKKHRVGLSDTLIPPKRALKMYTMQKDKM